MEPRCSGFGVLVFLHNRQFNFCLEPPIYMNPPFTWTQKFHLQQFNPGPISFTHKVNPGSPRPPLSSLGLSGPFSPVVTRDGAQGHDLSTSESFSGGHNLRTGAVRTSVFSSLGTCMWAALWAPLSLCPQKSEFPGISSDLGLVLAWSVRPRPPPP